MRIKYIPFSSGTSALDWQSYNCDPCRRRPCAARYALERCNNLTLNAVRLCGGKPHIQITPKAAFANLPARCASFIDISKRRDLGKGTPSLFGEPL